MHQAILARTVGHAARPVASTLRLIRSSSAALPPAVMSGLEAAFGVPVIESYGMTEASHQMASNPLPPRTRKPGSVGPSAGPEIAVLGASGDPVASGVHGEVVIRGPGVTRGYENLPQDAPSPVVRGWFRTGDQGYLDSEGYLFLTGRLKELINRGGEKIAPREIDEALLDCPGVGQAVAFAVPHPTLGEDVAAAVVPMDGVVLDEAAVRAAVFTRLPAFKVPSRILVVKDLPKGPSGKIQRIGLAGVFAPLLVTAYEAPASPMETIVCDVFASVLGHDRVGRLDNLFSLDGDSLGATQAANRLQNWLGFEVPVATLFRFPTAMLLSGALDGLRSAGLERGATVLEVPPGVGRERIPKAVPLRVEDGLAVAIHPASQSQHQLWFIYAMAPESPVYSVISAFRLQGTVDIEGLQAASDAVCRRHDSLRTTFAMGEDHVEQRVATEGRIPLEFEDFSHLPAAVRDDAAEKCLSREMSRPFVLESGPLTRLLLVRLGPADHRFLLLMHHIVSDGWSRRNLLHDLSVAYRAHVEGKPAVFTPLEIQPVDIAAWQQQQLASGARASEEAQWMSLLAGHCAPMDLPSDRPRPDWPTFNGARRIRLLPGELRHRLEQAAARDGATLFMVLLLGFALFLRRCTGRSDPIVATQISGRTRLEIEPLVGFITHTLPLRIPIHEGQSMREMLGNVRDIVLAAHARQEIPFDRLVELLKVRWEPGRPTLASVSFALRPSSSGALDLPGVEVNECDVPTGTAKLDLMLTAETSDSGWRAVAEYATDLFDASRADQWLQDWEQILGEVARDL